MPKGKIIKNPLREGLPSKIYLVAFPRRLTVGEIATEIYGEEKKSNRTRISNIIGNSRFSYLYHIKKPFKEDRRKTYVLSNVGPFLEELEESVKLTSKEKMLLKNYVSGPFRKAAIEKYLKADYRKPIDAYSELLGLLLLLVGAEIGSRKSGRLFKRLGFEKILSKTPFSFSEDPRSAFYEVLGEMLKEAGIEDQPTDDKTIYSPLYEFPDNLLQKLLSKASVSGSIQTLKYALGAMRILPWLSEALEKEPSHRKKAK